MALPRFRASQCLGLYLGHPVSGGRKCGDLYLQFGVWARGWQLLLLKHYTSRNTKSRNTRPNTGPLRHRRRRRTRKRRRRRRKGKWWAKWEALYFVGVGRKFWTAVIQFPDFSRSSFWWAQSKKRKRWTRNKSWVEIGAVILVHCVRYKHNLLACRARGISLINMTGEAT